MSQPSFSPYDPPEAPFGPAAGMPRVEPRAEMRLAATAAFEMFTAFKDAGFTEHQALIILGNMLSGGQKGGGE